MPGGNVTQSSISANGDTASVVLTGYGGGPGEKLHVQLIVTDTQGASDTTSVTILPEVDFQVTSLRTLPSTPGTEAPATYAFTIHNLGRMPAQASHWMLIADATALAEGDTIVAPLDSVVVERTLAPTLALGTYALRAVADTLGAITEVLETNNAETKKLDVVEGPGPDEYPPLFRAGPTHEGSGTVGHVYWETNELSTGTVRWGLSIALGDSVTTPLDSVHHAIITGLEMGTRYYYVVVAYDTLANFNVAALDSFTTTSGQTAVGGPMTLRLSAPRPNPTSGRTAMALDLPVMTRVRFSVHDIQGREVWSEYERVLDAGRWSLEWPGTDQGGAPMRAGIYLAQVQVDGVPRVFRFALLR
jgi:hypothetical protein